MREWAAASREAICPPGSVERGRTAARLSHDSLGFTVGHFPRGARPSREEWFLHFPRSRQTLIHQARSTPQPPTLLVRGAFLPPSPCQVFLLLPPCQGGGVGGVVLQRTGPCACPRPQFARLRIDAATFLCYSEPPAVLREAPGEARARIVPERSYPSANT